MNIDEWTRLGNIGRGISAIALAGVMTACGGGGGGGSGGVNQPPVAATVDSFSVNAGEQLTLDGSTSFDADGDQLAFEWRQVEGPDVTNAAGALSSSSPSVVAPDSVSTLVFELRVNDGSVNSTVSTFSVYVMEDKNAAVFVDGDHGDDESGTGARNAPFASIEKAIAEASVSGSDVYVASRTENQDALAYRTVGLVSVPPGVSLYGGFSSDWRRDVTNNRTMLWTDNGIGVMFVDVDRPTVLSGFDIQTGLIDNPRMRGPYAVLAEKGQGALKILDNSLSASLRLPLTFNGIANNNYGVFIANIDSVTLRRNTILSGDMSRFVPAAKQTSFDGRDGSDGEDAGESTTVDRGEGGDPLWVGADGGDGGIGHAWNGGFGLGDAGGDGQGPGGAGGEPSYGVAESGDDGSDGAAGADGRGGIGHAVVDANQIGGAGEFGADGAHGGGGGGGAGGASGILGEGGGGGGGGSGGEGGGGGIGGAAGGASIAVLVTNIASGLIIDGNTIVASSAGPGGAAGQGGSGGEGGYGGFEQGGNGGNPGKPGGDGGSGGNGGEGGGGGGGPSIGIVIGGSINAEITGNSITTGDGGIGGAGGFGGEGGYSIGIVDADLDDGITPFISANEFALGNPGQGGVGTNKGGDSGKAQALNW